MEKVSKQLTDLFSNSKLSDIEVFNAAPNYFEIKENQTWMFKGGVELSFGDQKFTLAWDYGNDSYDFNLEGGVKSLLKDLDYYSVDIKQAEPISELIGKTINNIEFEWEFYQDFNEDGEMMEEKFYVPVGIKLEFDNKNILQIATIEAQIKAEGYEIIDPVYNLCGDLLISVNNEIEIEQQRMEGEY